MTVSNTWLINVQCMKFTLTRGVFYTRLVNIKIGQHQNWSTYRAYIDNDCVQCLVDQNTLHQLYLDTGCVQYKLGQRKECKNRTLTLAVSNARLVKASRAVSCTSWSGLVRSLSTAGVKSGSSKLLKHFMLQLKLRMHAHAAEHTCKAESKRSKSLPWHILQLTTASPLHELHHRVLRVSQVLLNTCFAGDDISTECISHQKHCRTR